MLVREIFNKIKHRYDMYIHERRFREQILDKIFQVNKEGFFEQWKVEIEWLRENGVSGGRLNQIMIPYEWTDEYARHITVHKDNNGYNYAMIQNSLGDMEKLFYYKTWLKSSIAPHYQHLLMEQDIRSPHCYCNDKFSLPQDCVLIDIGCAEASFALMHIHDVKHAYLFENDSKWVGVLKKTFEPYKDKITIINKYVGDDNDDNMITLDHFYKTMLPKEHKNKLFIKIDIEGAEMEALKGAKELINDYNCDSHFSICTYHRYDDYINIPQLFDNKQFQTGFSEGWMIVDTSLLGFEDNDIPYFRKGIFYAKRIMTEQKEKNA